ncbi:hypothetical protein Bca101_034388 [Brassica carinata]
MQNVRAGAPIKKEARNREFTSGPKISPYHRKISVGTPYDNGLFRMKLALSHDYPHSPPKGYFMTKIFHPNVASNGEICVNTLKKDWNPSLGLRHVLSVVRCLLIEPFPESALNEQAGKMLLENYEEYARHARSSRICKCGHYDTEKRSRFGQGSGRQEEGRCQKEELEETMMILLN